MRKNGQISDEAREGVAVVVTSGSHQKPHHTRKKMAGGMGLSMRRELLELMLPQYQEAVPVDKRQVLEEFTRLTGYHRRYAMFLFNHHTGQRSKPAKPSCSRRYDSKVEEALVLIWNYTTRVCGKLLIPFLPTLIRSLEQYLRTECGCTSVSEITDIHVCNWVALGQTPTERGVMRAASTIELYARSARAWCQWLVRQNEMTKTSFASLTVPKGGYRPLHPIEAEEWEQLLVACQTSEREGVLAEQLRARNTAILWVLFETGIQVAEVCGLRLCDVNLEEGSVSVRDTRVGERRCRLGAQGAQALRAYMEKHRLKYRVSSRREEVLFVSERGRPLTANAFLLVFKRLKKRAGIRRKDMVPSLLRDSFAVRYLHVGGDLRSLRDILGREESAVVRRFVGLSEEVMKTSIHQERTEAQ